MKKGLWFAFILICACEVAHGQKAPRSPSYYASKNKKKSGSYQDGSASIGLGAGLDYGDIGLRGTFLPDPHVGIFAGVGYALAGIGFNGGAMARFQPDKKFVPTLSAMYGYNAALLVTSNSSNYNKLYYGPSVALGLISKSDRHEGNYWHFQIIVPFRSSEFNNDYNLIKSSVTVTPLPVLASVGYHFAID